MSLTTFGEALSPLMIEEYPPLNLVTIALRHRREIDEVLSVLPPLEVVTAR
jgi:hypothetical protein